MSCVYACSRLQSRSCSRTLHSYFLKRHAASKCLGKCLQLLLARERARTAILRITERSLCLMPQPASIHGSTSYICMLIRIAVHLQVLAVYHLDAPGPSRVRRQEIGHVVHAAFPYNPHSEYVSSLYVWACGWYISGICRHVRVCVERSTNMCMHVCVDVSAQTRANTHALTYYIDIIKFIHSSMRVTHVRLRHACTHARSHAHRMNACICMHT
jgi:hypothetical protein